jgi:hypothetical protein
VGEGAAGINGWKKVEKRSQQGFYRNSPCTNAGCRRLGRAPSILFSLRAKTGNGAQALTLNVDTEAPHLGMGGDPVSFSGCLSTKGNAIIQGVGMAFSPFN